MEEVLHTRFPPNSHLQATLSPIRWWTGPGPGSPESTGAALGSCHGQRPRVWPPPTVLWGHRAFAPSGIACSRRSCGLCRPLPWPACPGCLGGRDSHQHHPEAPEKFSVLIFRCCAGHISTTQMKQIGSLERALTFQNTSQARTVCLSVFIPTVGAQPSSVPAFAGFLNKSFYSHITKIPYLYILNEQCTLKTKQ